VPVAGRHLPPVTGMPPGSVMTSQKGTTMPTGNQGSVSSERAIENLISSYAFLNDDADIAGLGELFADAVFTLDETSARGREQIEQRARSIIQVNDDGTSQTRHTITNLIIEVDEEAGTANGRAYWTVFQSARGLPQEPVLAGRYRNRFERHDGTWRFTELNATTTWSAG
jgi:ketosteroid isomerase-like protein